MLLPEPSSPVQISGLQQTHTQTREKGKPGQISKFIGQMKTKQTTDIYVNVKNLIQMAITQGQISMSKIQLSAIVNVNVVHH